MWYTRYSPPFWNVPHWYPELDVVAKLTGLEGIFDDSGILDDRLRKMGPKLDSHNPAERRDAEWIERMKQEKKKAMGIK